jgi:hypothetical protein
MSHAARRWSRVGPQNTRPARKRGTMPTPYGDPQTEDVRSAEQRVSSRCDPRLIALERNGRYALYHEDAVISADVLGVDLTFKRTHMPRSQRPMRAREPVGRYSIPFVELPTLKHLRDLAAMSGYSVVVLHALSGVRQKPAKVVRIDCRHAEPEIRRNVCA